MSKKYITLEEIMNNTPRELYVEGVGTILIRDPTKRDTIEARLEASKMEIWNQLSEIDQAIEIQNRVILKMVVEPKITEEDYLNAPDSKISKIIDAVSIEYAKRIASFREERKKRIVDFLCQVVGREELLKMIGKKE